MLVQSESALPNHQLHSSPAYSEVVKLLVGNKVDQTREIPRERAEEWAKSRGMLFVEASAKTTEGVAQVFSEVVQQVINKETTWILDEDFKPSIHFFTL